MWQRAQLMGSRRRRRTRARAQRANQCGSVPSSWAAAAGGAPMSDRGRPNGPPPGRGRPPAMPSGPQSWSRPIVWALIAMVVIAFLLSPLLGGKKSNSIRYIPDFINKVNAGQVKSIDVYEDHSTRITGKYNDGKSFTTTVPAKLPDKD